MKRYRFKSDEARHEFAAISDINAAIANSVCDHVFYVAMPRNTIDEIFSKSTVLLCFPSIFLFS